jgi:voltage-gated potassium channel
MAERTSNSHRDELHQKRWELLEHINALTDGPLTVLSFVWLGLLILDLIQGFGPALDLVSNVIWACSSRISPSSS